MRKLSEIISMAAITVLFFVDLIMGKSYTQVMIILFAFLCGNNLDEYKTNKNKLSLVSAILCGIVTIIRFIEYVV